MEITTLINKLEKQRIITPTQKVEIMEFVEQNYDVKPKKEQSPQEQTYKTMKLKDLTPADVPNAQYLEIAKAFCLLFIQNLKEINLNRIDGVEKAKGTWVDDIRYIIEVDKHTIEELREVWEFLGKDRFWKSTVYSTSGLQRQFNKILIKARYEKRNSIKENTSWNELADILHKKLGR